jgi:uncharacterized protein
MHNFIRRDGYLDQIRPFIGKDIIKVFTGQRRVGKSYLMFQIMDEIMAADSDANIIYINMELHDFESIKNHADLIDFVSSKLCSSKKNYLFIDEIQDIESFEKSLRHFNATQLADIFCTGSNARLLSGELATLLSGRYIEFHVSGLSYPEFLRFHQLEDTNKSLFRYIRYGSLPYLKNLNDEEPVVHEYIKSVYNTILYKDIVTRWRIRNTTVLENLLRFLMNNTGSLFSAKKISDYLKSQQINISPKVIIEYLRYCDDAFLIYGVKRFGISGKKLFEVGEKYYFEDLGIRHAIGGYRMDDMGKILENLVFKHLQRNRFDVYVGTLGNKEIDFVGERGNERIYLQVAYRIDNPKTHEREFGNLLKIEDNFRKMAVSMDEYIEGSYEGIEHVHIRKLLTMKL